MEEAKPRRLPTAAAGFDAQTAERRMKTVCIGWDSNEKLPWHVLADSIIENASSPVRIIPVKHYLSRPTEGSTEFSLSRFLTPWLCDYKGLALFLDCDMLVRFDINELFDLKDDTAVQVVQHDYIPKDTVKFYKNTQKAYPRKNWSSVMLFDCSKCTNLTPEYVEAASAMELHQFKWTDSIGRLPLEYNHLVGEYSLSSEARIIHWTNGGPWLHKYRNSDYAEEWQMAKYDMMWFMDE